MVAHNPVLRGGFSLKKFNATVINDIWPEVAFFCLVATMVSLVSEMTSHKLRISPALLTVLGTVLGLVISFRTSSAYERYQDGRKMWTNIQTASRNIGQMIWIHVPNERVDKDKQKKQTVLQSVIEKKSMLNLVQAFSVSVKHFLRGEAGVYYQDLYPLLCFLPRYAVPPTSEADIDMLPLWQASEDGEHPFDHAGSTRSVATDDTAIGKEDPKATNSWMPFGQRVRRVKTFDPEKALACVQAHRPLKPSRNPPKTSIYDFLPFLMIFKPITRLFRKKKPEDDQSNRNALGRKRKPVLGDSNVPLEITLVLSNYSAFLMRSGLLQASVASGLVGNITMLQDTLSNLERIGNTPLPFAYQAHLRMSLWIYLFLLPFQVEQVFGYLTIPGTAFASFLLLGFLEIGQEIENPFGYDANDLDLDDFCLSIQRELHEISAHTTPDPDDFLFNTFNHPFAPADQRHAESIIKGGDYSHPEVTQGVEPGMASMRKTLLRNWMDVEVLTRHSH